MKIYKSLNNSSSMGLTLTSMFNKLKTTNNIDDIINLYPHFYQGLINKAQRINSSQEFRENRLRINGHTKLPRYVDNFFDERDYFLSLESVSLLLMKDINLKHKVLKENKKLESILQNQDTLEWFESYRLRDKLVFKHTTKPNGRRQMQVYSKPISITAEQNKHLSTSSGSGSKYTISTKEIEKIDFLGFNNGIGHFTYASDINDFEDRLYLYLKLNKSVGITKDRKSTQYVRFDINNKKNPNRKSNNYTQEIHSYPISIEEINRDCSKALKEQIDKNMILLN